MRITNIVGRKVFLLVFFIFGYVWVFLVVTLVACSDFLVEGEVVYTIVKVPNGKYSLVEKLRNVISSLCSHYFLLSTVSHLQVFEEGGRYTKYTRVFGHKLCLLYKQYLYRCTGVRIRL